MIRANRFTQIALRIACATEPLVLEIQVFGGCRKFLVGENRGANILADPAKAMVDMIFLYFPGFGYRP